MAFNFGQSSTPASSFTFGSSSASTPSGGFSFGGTGGAASSTPAAPSGGFSFGSTAPAEAKKDDAKAPASSGGFSFGGTGGAASSTPAAPSGGFSFGSTAPAPAESKKDDAKAPASSGGFSFGGTSASASTPSLATISTPAGKTGDNGDSKSSTPAPSGFSFGDSTPSVGVNTPAGVSTPAGVETPAGANTPVFKKNEKESSSSASETALTKIEPPPSTYQNQTVEEIINSLSQSLESCSIQFLNQARRVASQDELLRLSQSDIYNLSNQLSTLLVQQEELDQRLTQVGDVQNNLISELDTLEGQVDTLFERSMGALEGGHVDDADAERERYFSLAIETEGRLTSLEEEIETIEKSLQSLRELNNDNSNDDLAIILKTMNQNHDLLSALEGRCAKIESDMHLVSKSMY